MVPLKRDMLGCIIPIYEYVLYVPVYVLGLYLEFYLFGVAFPYVSMCT